MKKPVNPAVANALNLAAEIVKTTVEAAAIISFVSVIVLYAMH